MPQHAIERINIGLHRLGQLRRGSKSLRDVVGYPQGCSTCSAIGVARSAIDRTPAPDSPLIP
jgi:hypothetical protein